MQSSYNVIKSQFAKSGEKKVISTEYEIKNLVPEVPEEEMEEEVVVEPKIDPEEVLRKYEEIGKNIIEEAQNNKQRIEMEAEINAENKEKEAYEKGYAQGIQNGQEDGYNKAYNETIEKAKAEAEAVVKNAEDILKNAQNDYSEYIDSKKSQVIDLALNIAGNILRKKLEKEDSMNELIEEAFRLSKGEQSIVIKINPEYEKEIRKHIDKWKVEYSINGEIFIMTNNSIEKGNAVIEKSSGVIKVGIEIGMEQIRKALFG